MTIPGVRAIGNNGHTDDHNAIAARLATTETVVNVVDGFGATGDGVTDDSTAIQAAVDSLDDGGIVVFPAGTFMAASQIVVKNKVIIRGQGRQATRIKATAAFPINTPLVRLGDGTSIVFGCRLENIIVDCNNISGSTAVYSDEIQEQSGLSYCTIEHYRSVGLDLDGVSIVGINHCEFFPSTSGSTAGVRFTDTVGTCYVNDTTVNGSDGGTHADGLIIDNSDVCVYGFHAEAMTDGVDVRNGGTGVLIGLYGNASVTNLLHLSANTNHITAFDLLPNGAAVTILDDFEGVGGLTGFVRVYFPHDVYFGPLSKIRGLGTNITLTGNLRVTGSLGVGNSAAASGPVGSVVKKIQVYDSSGNSLGYLPVYNAIT